MAASITAKIIALKHEKDGDYHLVLQGPSGQQMVAEIPTPTSVFIGDSPWLENIRQARKEIDDKLWRRPQASLAGRSRSRWEGHASGSSPEWSWRRFRQCYRRFGASVDCITV